MKIKSNIFLLVLSVFLISCNHLNGSEQHSPNEKMIMEISGMLDSAYKDFLFTIPIYQDSIKIAKDNDDVDLALAYLLRIDREVSALMYDYTNAVFMPAYCPLEKDSIWEWMANQHYREVIRYMDFRISHYGIQENPVDSIKIKQRKQNNK